MKKLIIGIHGLANKPEKEVLAKYWETSINEGLEHVKASDIEYEFSLVYWADFLYCYPMHQKEGYAFDSLYNDEPHRPPTKLKEYKEGVMDKARNLIGKSFGPGMDWFKNTFGVTHIADAVLGAKLKDLDYYYQDKKVMARDGILKGARTVLRQELYDTLMANKDREIMLIAHSMGTIIAYDVLRRIGQSDPDVSISHLVTIGSPLGLPHVKEKIVEGIEKEGRKDAAELRTPAVITNSWVNYADKYDPVALDAHLADDYGKNKAGVKVRDDMVSNDYVGLSGEPNHHKSYGYLRTPELARQIKTFLEG